MKEKITNAASLEKRVQFLQAILDRSPAGSLHCRHRGSKTYYYWEKSVSGKTTEKYLSAKDAKLIKQLAQKSYARKILPILKKDLKFARMINRDYNGASELVLADELAPAIVWQCGPGFESRKIFVREWQKKTWTEAPNYAGQPDKSTLSGILVRSKSEDFIANALHHHGLAFHYEKPLQLNGHGYPKFPDFTVLHPQTLDEVYWEHFGRMDDPAYASTACRKIREYEQAGFQIGRQLICTFETSDCTLSSMDVERVIKNHFG